MDRFQNIPVAFDKFPKGYINDINGWAFDRKTIEENAGKLLTLDIDFGSRCSLECEFCFRKNNSVDQASHELGMEGTLDLLHQAKALGLRSVKFLGAGEPFETPELIQLLREMHKMDIIPLIFTKGHIIGDDQKVRNLFRSRYGISTGEQLVEELFKLNTSIMLGFHSFDDAIQQRMVGNAKSYIGKRDRALNLLVDAGFSEFQEGKATRLALAINPVTTRNYAGTFELYKWARRRNMYAIVAPPMVSGRSKRRGGALRPTGWARFTPSADDLLKLYTEIYQFNLDSGLQTRKQLEEEGIAAYAGGHPCNQVACGLYVTLNGVVLSCPGSEEMVEGNFHNNTLQDIWENSENYKRKGTFNCNCIAKDGKTIPGDLYHLVNNQFSKSGDLQWHKY